MTNIPGHHGRGMEANGPIVAPGGGYREIIAVRTETFGVRDYFFQCAKLVQRSTRRLMDQRAAEIEEGLVHQTPAMAESLEKLGG